MAIVEYDCRLERTTFNVLRVLSRVLTDKIRIRDLFESSEAIGDADDETLQLQFDFKYEILLNISGILYDLRPILYYICSLNLKAMEKIYIRDAAADDVPFISRCILAATGALDICDKWQHQNNGSVTLMEELCALEHSLYSWSHVRIACDGDIPVGCLLSYDGKRYARAREFTFSYAEERIGKPFEDSDMETCKDEYYMDSMAILPSYRKRRIGLMLMSDAVERGRMAGHTRFSLMAEKKAISLQEYYRKAGFMKEEEIRFFGHQYYRMILCVPPLA